MIIDCFNCQSKVDAKVIASEVEYPTEELPFEYRVSFLQCPACKTLMLGGQAEAQLVSGQPVWDSATRLWPESPKFLDYNIPTIIRTSLEEAVKCFQAGAYSACAVMCGKAIEAVCVHHKTKDKNLSIGLRELKENNVIDARLYKWGEALRTERNIGAHVSDTTPSKADARDILDFAVAICDYVFVLSAKYDQFIARKLLKNKEKPTVKSTASSGKVEPKTDSPG